MVLLSMVVPVSRQNSSTGWMASRAMMAHTHFDGR